MSLILKQLYKFTTTKKDQIITTKCEIKKARLQK
jgi:hypothetical protein